MCAMDRFGIGRRAPLLFTAIAVMLFLAWESGRAQERHDSKVPLATKLRVKRTSATDLEIGGDVRGVPHGLTSYLPREDLLAISQAMSVTANDGSFTVPSKVKAVLLEDLVRNLSVYGSDMVVAICDDKYRASYPRAYLAAHHPILVLEYNGKSPEEWAKVDGFDNGPYLISHTDFRPSFKILGYSDEPQIPWSVVRLEFRDEESVFGAIAPRGAHASDEAVQDGFKIAKQNCFRCHNDGAEGGLKSGVTWVVLAALAANSPEFFVEYVRDPTARTPKSQMPKWPECDDATMRALVAYFKAFAPTEAH
jgi:mono/diheme cytochrome c family protein